MMYYFSVIAPQAIALLLAYWLYLAVRESFAGDVPSAPAAIGRALGILVFGQVVGFYLLWYFVTFRMAPFLVNPATIETGVLHGLIAGILAICSGFVAKRTFETTKSMNLKIVAVIGLFAQGLITVFDFTQGSTTSFALWLYVPLVILGGYVFNRYSEQRKNDRTEHVMP